ncbi:hypothetical protein CYMTET_40856 [Cymbomonas tetramitiformis]|uniref:Uncharacterized protein n=1 Tax=Cymbomonas tetramitiformis TaxID=36881 RepID=A0AAE0F380_9CHLO|nr:hypothetical protein CYMTET_40856 [Cymbomonas tetramitiformis]
MTSLSLASGDHSVDDAMFLLNLLSLLPQRAGLGLTADTWGILPSDDEALTVKGLLSKHQSSFGHVEPFGTLGANELRGLFEHLCSAALLSVPASANAPCNAQRGVHATPVAMGHFAPLAMAVCLVAQFRAPRSAPPAASLEVAAPAVARVLAHRHPADFPTPYSQPLVDYILAASKCGAIHLDSRGLHGVPSLENLTLTLPPFLPTNLQGGVHQAQVVRVNHFPGRQIHAGATPGPSGAELSSQPPRLSAILTYVGLQVHAWALGYPYGVTWEQVKSFIKDTVKELSSYITWAQFKAATGGLRKFVCFFLEGVLLLQKAGPGGVYLALPSFLQHDQPGTARSQHSGRAAHNPEQEQRDVGAAAMTEQARRRELELAMAVSQLLELHGGVMETSACLEKLRTNHPEKHAHLTALGGLEWWCHQSAMGMELFPATMGCDPEGCGKEGEPTSPRWLRLLGDGPVAARLRERAWRTQPHWPSDLVMSGPIPQIAQCLRELVQRSDTSTPVPLPDIASELAWRLPGSHAIKVDPLALAAYLDQFPQEFLVSTCGEVSLRDCAQVTDASRKAADDNWRANDENRTAADAHQEVVDEKQEAVNDSAAAAPGVWPALVDLLELVPYAHRPTPISELCGRMRESGSSGGVPMAPRVLEERLQRCPEFFTVSSCATTGCAQNKAD